MALSGLDIYKLLAKTNCKDCGYSTCLAFAMALAQKKTSLDKCPHVSKEASEALESASQPPIKLVTIGKGDSRLEIGNETVMYRHEQKFYHPAGIGFIIDDKMNDADIDARLSKINALAFERVGLSIKPDAICIKNSSNNKDQFVKAVAKAVSGSKLNIVLCAKDAAALDAALKICSEKRPLVVWDGEGSLDAFVKLAKENAVPLAVTCSSPDEIAQAVDTAKKGGVDEIVVNIKEKSIAKRIQLFTYMRRAALRKNFRPFGYPAMAFTAEGDEAMELCEAVTYVLKYAGLVIVNNIEKEFVFPLLVARQDIYSDPQKPVQVEPKIYEIGKVNSNSPVIVTTNFSITYFTVAGEVEASKVPTYIISCDSEGMSVLTAWAAEKFTAERIIETMKKTGIESIVGHKKVIIPGYASVLSGRLQELSGWSVVVGPREASGLPNFLRNLK